MSNLAELRAVARAHHHLPTMVAKTVLLETAWSGLRGACAFHPDASRGLYVSAQHFHCFSCGASGDVIDWWMRLHRTDVATATAYLSLGAPGDNTDEDSEKPC